jgi:hypothetical protein
VGLVCFGLWLLVAAPGLRRAAETSPLGARRTAALAVLGPVARLSAALGLDRIQHSTDAALGRDSTPTPSFPPAGFAEPSSGASLGTSPTATGPAPGSSPTSGSGERTTGPPAPMGPPVLATPANAAPLRILTVGDSLGEDLGIGLSRLLADQPGFVPRTDARQATGLARSDYFDWPAQLAVDLQRFHPGVVVAMFGANDDQSVLVGGHGYLLGTREWRAAYRARVATIMREATAGGRPLIWVGMPVMKASGLSNVMSLVNWIVRTEAAAHPGVLYVDSWSLFADASGHYSAYLPDASGNEQLVREGDGVHLTAAGMDRIAGRVFGTMSTLWAGRGRPEPARP